MQLFWISPLDSAQTMKLQFHWASRRTEPHVVTKSYIPSSTDIHAEKCLSFFNKKFFASLALKSRLNHLFFEKIKINKYPSKINSIMCIILSLSFHRIFLKASLLIFGLDLFWFDECHPIFYTPTNFRVCTWQKVLVKHFTSEFFIYSMLKHQRCFFCYSFHARLYFIFFTLV